MIVSASYRTDIPAFYGAWFVNRLEAGFCRVANPYGGAPIRVPLGGPEADGFVFWTRNAAPFAAALDAVAARRVPFVVHYTVTGYPRALEVATPPAARAVAAMRGLSDRFGPRAVVWRYDPILVTSMTETGWHIDNFVRIAAALAGATDEVVVSFTQLYAKTQAALAAAARRHGFAWRDPEPPEKRDLLRRLAAIAGERGMRLTLCTQPGLVEAAWPAARCIDAERLSDVAGRRIAARTKGNRPGCACAESRDIGAYDSCPQGCVYCYAVRGRAPARRRLHGHDPAGEFLAAPRPPAGGDQATVSTRPPGEGGGSSAAPFGAGAAELPVATPTIAGRSRRSLSM